MPSTPLGISAGRATSFSVLSRAESRYFRWSTRFRCQVRFPAAPQQKAQVRDAILGLGLSASMRPSTDQATRAAADPAAGRSATPAPDHHWPPPRGPTPRRSPARRGPTSRRRRRRWCRARRIRGRGSAWPPRSNGIRASSTARAYWRIRTRLPSEPTSRPEGDRSLIEDLPTALAASVGRSATLTSRGGRSAATSISRTAPSDRHRTWASCAVVAAISCSRSGCWRTALIASLTRLCSTHASAAAS